MGSDTTDGSTSVKISGKEVMLKNKSCFSKSTGDEAGAAPKKGLVTSKNTGKVYFNMWSMDVKVEGENVVRHLDITTHNHSSTPGNSPPMPHTDAMSPGGAGAGADQPCPRAAAVGSPVNPVSGAKVLAGDEDNDFTLPGPLPFVWRRTYHSRNMRVGWHGCGWSSPLELALERSTIGGIEFIDNYGRRIAFPRLLEGQSYFLVSERLTLIREAGGAYVVREPSGHRLRFEIHGTGFRLESLSDRNGNSHRLEYELRTGHMLVHASGGQRVRLGFDANRRLVSIEDLRGASAAVLHAVTLCRYGYDAEGQLIEVRARTGERLRAFGWHRGLMVRQVHGSFEADYDYALVDGSIRVVRHRDNVGRQWTFEYAEDHTRVTDQEGRATLYHFDVKRRWTGVTDPIGQTTRRCLDENGHVRAIVDPAGNVTETWFDDRGNPEKIADPTGAVTSIEWHDTFALPVRIVDACGNAQRIEYDERGNVIARTDATGAVTRYEVDDRGLAVAIVDANGGRKLRRHDARGLLVAETDCSQRTTELVYDDDGWIVSLTNALGQTTNYEHDFAGRLTLQTLPDGSRESYRYDVRGMPTLIAEAAGQSTEFRYDPDGQIRERIDAEGHVMTYHYDRARRLALLINENGARHTCSYDAADRLVRETTFDGRRIDYVYDGAGFLTSQTEAAGTAEAFTTEFQCDAMGRLLRRSTPNSWSEFEYNGLGQPVVARNSASTVRMFYDDAGRFTKEVLTLLGRDFVSEYAHDGMGNRTRSALPNGTCLGTLYYGSGHAHSILNGSAPVADFERDALHRETQRSQGALISRRDYDVAGRIVAQRAGAGPGAPAMLLTGVIERRYEHDATGRLSAFIDRGNRVVVEHDTLGRLRRFGDQRFEFDPAQNLVSSFGPGGSASRGRIENERLIVFEDKRYRYDAHGRVTEKRSGPNRRQKFVWSDEHRLESVETEHDGQRGITRYLYDAYGRRILKRGADGDCHFVWEGDRLAQERNPGGATTTYVYEPQSFIPLARIVRAAAGADTAADKIDYYHCDHIGLPRELTAEDGRVVWAAEFEAWGCQKYGSHSSAAAQPLRFQGQYADDESGLHYNRFRYYDPDVGRFLTADPIGLEGGDNSYSYAPDPEEWLDPLGLSVRKDLYPTRVRKKTRAALDKKATGADGKMRCGDCGCEISKDTASVQHSPALVDTHNTLGWDTDQATRNNLYNNTATDLHCLTCQKKEGGSMSHCSNYRPDTGPSFKPRGSK